MQEVNPDPNVFKSGWNKVYVLGPRAGYRGRLLRPNCVSRTITWERGHKARASDDRKTPSTCRTHSFALLFDTSRSCRLAAVGGRQGTMRLSCNDFNNKQARIKTAASATGKRTSETIWPAWHPHRKPQNVKSGQTYSYSP